MIGLLHSSMVPPVLQVDTVTCRYHEFAERSLFFTRGYGINQGRPHKGQSTDEQVAGGHENSAGSPGPQGEKR